MTRRLRPALALAAGCVMVAGSAARAEGWSISLLETMPAEQACMDKARRVISQYLFDHGGGNTASDTWSIYAFDLEPGKQDAVIMCPTGGGGDVEAILVIHSETEADVRTTLVERLLAIWNDT